VTAISTFCTPGEVIFGAGARSVLPDKASEFGAQRILLVTDQGLRATGQPAQMVSLLRTVASTVETFDQVSGEPSIETLEACRAVVRANGFDLVVALGGGSAMDTAKAAACLAYNDGPAAGYFGVNLIPAAGLPLIAMPTTAGTASEVTPNAVFADLSVQVKKAIVSRHLLPKVALIDPELTYSVPPAITAGTGMDALVHAVESYVSPRATVLTQTHALKAMELMSGHLRRAVADGQDKAAREALAWGSLIAGFSFATAGVGAVHALAYPLGGKFHVPHGVANAMLLAPVMQFSAPAQAALFATMARSLSVDAQGLTDEALAERGVETVRQLCRDIGIPQRLRDLGVPRQALEPMAAEASKIERLLINGPRLMALDDIRAVYSAIW